MTTLNKRPSGSVRKDQLKVVVTDGEEIFNSGLVIDYIDLWTPSLEFGGANTGMTQATQSGSYTRIGRLVFVSFNLILSAKGSSTGTATIAGLPFAVGDYINASAEASGIIGYYSGMAALSGPLTLYASDTNDTLTLVDHGAATSTDATQLNFTDTSNIRGSIIYQTDAA